MHNFCDNLNQKQKEAVSLGRTHSLILAGAGSGKTLVITHRVAFLCQSGRAMPHNILAVTFTNKAANEMNTRIQKMLEHDTRGGMWIGTFHSISYRMLRMHWQEAGLHQHFQIIDSDDQLGVIREVLKKLELDDKKWQPKKIQSFINSEKNHAVRPNNIKQVDDFHQKTMLHIYQQYQAICDKRNLLDFAEILLKCYELLKNNQSLREHYQNRFTHVLVDEFQDSNYIQYAWLKLFHGENTCFMVVGDDDQSIYSWRGAKVQNMMQFLQDFDGAVLIKLEQNYRSTQNILSAANAVIANNKGRLGKNLWTDHQDGAPINSYSAYNEVEEARFIARTIKQAQVDGMEFDSIAILYRSNAQSRVIEEELIRNAIPYIVHAGVKFFERAEIKHALAYLRLMLLPEDDAAFLRVINVPARGLGQKTVEKIQLLAEHQNVSLWQSIQIMIENSLVSKRVVTTLQQFVDVINYMNETANFQTLAEQARCVVEKSGLLDLYKKEQTELAKSRVANLIELVDAAKQFSSREIDENVSPLAAFLSYAVIEAEDSNKGQGVQSVRLMTLHTAKGLEFSLVFLSGMEDELFPPVWVLQDEQRLEEERRLCYVGMTRAKKLLYITHAEERRHYGKVNKCHISRFIKEIPEQYINHLEPLSVLLPDRMQNKWERNTTRKRFGATANLKNTVFPSRGPWKLGQMVEHTIFGKGVIINCEYGNTSTKLHIRFFSSDSKWILADESKLKIIN
ncbi:MAG: DNA helicase II [Thiotrichales bacterium]|nr:MAG: DNA helicase II [Thiotrichales bacterium]